MNTKRQLVTIYTLGEMFGGILRTEAYLLEHGTRPYAQYPAAPYVRYIPKGKRKERGFIQGFEPYLVIVEGVGPQPDCWKVERQGDMEIRQSKYPCFDSRYRTEFDEILAKSGAKILADYRFRRPQGPVVKPDKYRLIQMMDGQMVRSEFTGANVYDAMEARGYKFLELNTCRSNRVELQLQPIFSGLCGPMWDEDAIRYETKDVYDLMSA